jgi:hypothetical protein
MEKYGVSSNSKNRTNMINNYICVCVCVCVCVSTSGGIYHKDLKSICERDICTSENLNVNK